MLASLASHRDSVVDQPHSSAHPPLPAPVQHHLHPAVALVGPMVLAAQTANRFYKLRDHSSYSLYSIKSYRSAESRRRSNAASGGDDAMPLLSTVEMGTSPMSDENNDEFSFIDDQPSTSRAQVKHVFPTVTKRERRQLRHFARMHRGAVEPLAFGAKRFGEKNMTYNDWVVIIWVHNFSTFSIFL